MKLFILAALMLASINAENVRYDNYTLFKLEPQTVEQIKFLKELHETNKYDFWTIPSENVEWVNLVSSPELRSHLLELLEENGISSQIAVENIQEVLDQQQPRRHRRDTSRSLFWTNFQLLEDMYEWFDELAASYPNIVTVVQAGRSYEGREIKGIRISRNSGRRAFFLEGGMIGADWLSPVTVTYIANELIHSEDPETRQASLDYDWYIVPVTNPDGYEFSQNSIRLWTKNRRPLGGGNVGVDLTKNWNSHWGVSGSSFTTSANNYVGPGPFSEIETRSLSEYISTIPRLYAFLSFRALGQRLILPFAHSSEPLYNYYDMILVGRRAMGSLAARYGTLYLVGNSIDVYDGATGSAADWAKYRFNPSIVATYQLRDNGNAGYLIPVAQVQPNCEEVFDSILALVREGRDANL